jgi:hypothetical protein
VRTAALIIAAVAVAAACSNPEPRPEPAKAPGAASARTATPSPTPPPAPPPAPVFSAVPPAAISASGDTGGLAAWASSKTAAFVQPLDAEGSPTGEAREVPLTLAHKLHAVYAVGGGFAIAAHDLCPDRKYFYKCLFLRAISAKGAPVGGEQIATTREWIREELVARSGGVTAVLTSNIYIPPALMRLSLAPDGALKIERSDIEVDEDLVGAVRLTATATGFAVLLRAESGNPARLIYAAIDAQGKIVEGPRRLAPGATGP